MTLHIPKMMTAPRPTFELLNDLYVPSVSNLRPDLTINGATVWPDFVYMGGDANAVNWPGYNYGETLGIQAGTAPSYNQGSPLLGTLDDSVKFNTGGYYQASNNTFADIATEDIVMEIVFTAPITINNRICSKGDTDNAPSTFDIYRSTSSTMKLYMADSDAHTASISSAGLVASVWYHALIFVDFGAFGQWYINGNVSGSAGTTSSLISVSSAAPFRIAIDSNSGNNGSSNIAYFSMWKKAAWLDTHLQATVAADRFYRLTGFYPQHAAGTAIPTSYTRFSQAYLDKYENSNRVLYQVGASWPRQSYRKDSNGIDFKGYLSEGGIINKLKRSEEFGSTWTKIDAGDTIGGTVVAPNKAIITTGGIIPDSTNGQHGVTQPSGTVLTVNNWAFSVWAKAGSSTWLYLANTTVANCTCYFDLSTPAVGTAGAGAVGYCEDWGDGWVRCCIVFTGTAATHTFQISPAGGDNDNTVVGNGTDVHVYIFGAQLELKDFMSSYKQTGLYVAARETDILYYKGDDGNLGGVGSDKIGTINCRILIPHRYGSGWESNVIKLYNSVSGDYITIYIDDAHHQVCFISSVIDGDFGNTIGNETNLCDNIIHNLKFTWKTDEMKIYADGEEAGPPDSDVDIPGGLNCIYIGGPYSNVNFFDGLINNIRIYKKIH